MLKKQQQQIGIFSPKTIMRIKKQFNDLQKQIANTYNYSIQILSIQGEYKSGVFLLYGPLQSPYQGLCFRVQVIWPFDYPFKPPKIKFIDKIWNPFVNQKGEICMDILQHNFSPASTVRTFLLSVQSLIGEYKLEGQSFANVEAASQMINNYNYFFKVAKEKAELNSFKRKQIYNDRMRGLPEEINILHYEDQKVQEAIENDLKQKKYQKKKDKQSESQVKSYTQFYSSSSYKE